MNRSHLRLLLSAVALVGLLGCQQETPAEKAGASAKSAAELKVEQAAQSAVDAIKAPMDRARQVEGKLEKAADRTAETAKEESTP